jgi:hypothetical protein
MVELIYALPNSVVSAEPKPKLVKKDVFVNKFDRFLGAGVFGQNRFRPSSNSEVHMFCNGKGVINLNAEIPDGALNLGVAKQ